MANEIHSLKIGNTEYPIYSEGLKIDDQVSGSAFLVVDGPDNRKVGTSTAIFGDGTSLTLASRTINIGNGYEGYEPTVIIGDNAGMLYIGGGSTNPVTIHIGAGNDGQAPSNIKMGTPEGSIEIGIDADNIVLGQNTSSINIGENSNITIGEASTINIGQYGTTINIGEHAGPITIGQNGGPIEIGYDTSVTIGEASGVGIGQYGSTIDVGEVADEVNIGRMSYGVNIGNQCEGNVVIGDGSVWTSEDEDGNEIVEKTTNTIIGENNYAVNIGSAAETVGIGIGAVGVGIGPGANGVSIGPNANGVLIGAGAKNINIGSTATDYVSIVAGSDDAEAAIAFSDGNGTYGTTQRIMIKSVEDKNSGSDIYSSLLINGVTTSLESSYEGGWKSSINMSDEFLVISNEQPNDAVGKRTSSIELGDKTSDYGGINLTASQCGINISTTYLPDEYSLETGDMGDINIQSSDGKINLNSNSSTNITAEGDLNLTTNQGDIDITSENHSINIDAATSMYIDAGGAIDIKSGAWIKNLARAFFIGEAFNGVPTDEYIENCTHNIYINAFPYTSGSPIAPILIKSGGLPRVITTTHVDGTSTSNNMTSYGGLSSFTNVEIGKDFNIKNDIISSNFFSSVVPNAATFSVGNKLKDSYVDTWTNVSLKTKADAEGVISMRVNDVYETNNNADVHSTIELTPLDYKSLCKWVDSDGESTYQSYMNMESYSDTDNIVIGSKYMYGDGIKAQHDIKISNDDFTGIQLYGNYYNGESTTSLDMNYNGIDLSYDYPPDGMNAHINMDYDVLSLSYSNGYGDNETIELGENGTTITVSNLQMPIPIGDGSAYSPGIKLTHPSSYGGMGTIIYCNSTSQYIAPIGTYSTGSNVNLGTAAKRFGYIYTTYGYATNGFSTSSDERLKDFGENIEVDLDALAALRKSYYRWNETSGFDNEKDRMLGMSAQEVQKIYPEVVNTDEDGMLSMAYDRLSVVALAAIDKLHETNKELKAENDELKDRIANLENLVDTILSRIN